MSGSQWACRETFVALIVTNLPIIQPLIRKGASKIGLSALFSRQRTTYGESHQLQSNDPNGSRFGGPGSRKKGPASHPLSVPRTEAWGSDEQIILPQQGRSGDGKAGGGGIVVTQEIGVKSERVSKGADPAADDWGYGSANKNGSYLS